MAKRTHVLNQADNFKLGNLPALSGQLRMSNSKSGVVMRSVSNDLDINLTSIGGNNVLLVGNEAAVLTIADTGTASLGTGATKGLLIVNIVEDNATGLFILQGTTGASVEVSDPAALFSITAANAGTVNVYRSGTTYTIENRRGAGRNFTMTLLR